MDDRKFDETMRSYVASTAKGEEHDLAKLKAEEKPKSAARGFRNGCLPLRLS